METSCTSSTPKAADGKALEEDGDASGGGSPVDTRVSSGVPGGSGEVRMVVMDALSPALLQQLKTDMVGGPVMVTATGEQGQVITLQVMNMEEASGGAALGLRPVQLLMPQTTSAMPDGLQPATIVTSSSVDVDGKPLMCQTFQVPEGYELVKVGANGEVEVAEDEMHVFQPEEGLEKDEQQPERSKQSEVPDYQPGATAVRKGKQGRKKGPRHTRGGGDAGGAAIDLEDEDEEQETKTSKVNAKKVVGKKKPPKPTKIKKKGVNKTFQCEQCDYTCPRRSDLDRHLTTHSNDRPHKCHLCERAFRTATLLRNHLNTHTGTRPHKCTECDMAFVTAGELIRHRRYKHTHEKPFKCSVCDYSSVEVSKLKRHIRSHTGERPFQCSLCSYASRDTYKLKRHLRTHTGEKPYECDICHACFTQSGTLKVHIQQKHTENVTKFQCPHCETLISRKSDLAVHIKNKHSFLENGETCRYCPAVFHERYALTQHQKTHSQNQKLLKCDECDYSCKLDRHMVMHRRTHTGERPFACSQCEQTFSHKSVLDKHFKRVHDPSFIQATYICQKCTKTFSRRNAMLCHAELCNGRNDGEEDVTEICDDDENSGEEDAEETRDGGQEEEASDESAAPPAPPPPVTRRGRRRKVRRRKDDNYVYDDDTDPDQDGDGLFIEMEVEQAPAATVDAASVQPLVKKKRGRPSKNQPAAYTVIICDEVPVLPAGEEESGHTVGKEQTDAQQELHIEAVGTDERSGTLEEEPEEGVEEKLSAAGVKEVQEEVSEETAVNGELTPEMILSMMDR